MFDQLTVPQWLSLPAPVRQRLVVMFNLPKSSGVRVENIQGVGRPVVTSDGHTNADLARLNAQAIAKQLKTDLDDFYKLFDRLLQELERDLETPVEPPDQATTEVPEGSPEGQPEASGKPCCGSKGFNHKKTCPTKVTA